MAESLDPKKENKPVVEAAGEKAEDAKTTLADTASSAAAATASAATAVKDNVFSMFGGGPKKEKKVEEEVNEPSGSSKAQKNTEVGFRP
jgi:Ran-binding protein 1